MPHSPPCTPAELSYSTPDLPGVGGVLKQRPTDFVVDEQPLYQPVGHGEHLMLYIEKEGMTTIEVVRRLAKIFKVRRSDVGYAGLKDKHAVTRQHLTIYLPNPRYDAELVEKIGFTPIRVLWATRHTNKIRRGHHGGNLFSIRIREVDPTHVVAAKAIFDELVKRGAPNYIGEQRFGFRQRNHLAGAAMLRGEYRRVLDILLGEPEGYESEALREARLHYMNGQYAQALEAWPRRLHHDRQALDALRQGLSDERSVKMIDVQQREFLVGATQSAIFNQVLDERLRSGKLHELVPGDLAWKHENGAVFSVDESIVEKENANDGRMRSIEVSPTGPMHGPDMMQPTAQPFESESRVLTSWGLRSEDFGKPPFRMHGSRRPMRMAIGRPDISAGVDEHGPFIRVAFELAGGCFATTLLREIMKTQTRVSHTDTLPHDIEEAT